MRKSLSVILAALLVFLSFSVFAESDAELMATVSTPTIRTSNVIKGVEIALSCTTSNAKIYYTLDGTTPTSSSALYDDNNRPILDTAGTYTIQAIAYNSTLTSKSSVSSYSKTVQSVETVAAADGVDMRTPGNITRYPQGSESPEYALLTFNFESPYYVYYMYGNSHELDPDDTENVFRYTETVKIYKTTVVYYRIYRVGYAPTKTTYAVTVNVWGGKQTVEKPTIKQVSFYGGKYLSLSTATEGATIRYKSSASKITDELTTENTTVYTDKVPITKPGKYYFKAYATMDGWFDSDQTSGDQYFVITQCEKPTVTKTAQGTLNKITITSTEDDVELYYTTDGTTPSQMSLKYTAPFMVNTNATIRAVACRKGSVSSEAVSLVIGDGTQTVAVPTASAVTSVDGSKTVTLSAESGASIYYCYFTEPQSSILSSDFKLYTEPITFNETGNYYFYMKAYKDGVYSSIKGVTVAVTVTVTVAKPVFSAETLSNGAKVVKISAEEDSRIYYVISDTKVESKSAIPRDNDHLYTYPITFTETKYISAIAVRETASGEIVSEISGAQPLISNGPVTLDKVGAITINETVTGTGVKVTLSCADSDADLFYIFDNSPDTVATTGSTAYNGVFELNTDGYLHVVAAKPGYEYAVETRQINFSRTADPQITISELGSSSFMVRFDCATPNAKYYYTTDNSEPTVNDNNLAALGMAVVDSGVTLKVIAVADGYNPSNVVTQIITNGEAQKCGDVLFNTTDVIGGKTVYLVSVTSGATIYYTLDGTEPTMNSLVYDENSPLRFTAETDVTIRAKAVKSGYYNSDITEEHVTVTRLSMPKFQEAKAQSSDGRNIYKYRFTCEEEFAYIYYTVDGTAPVVDAANTELYLGEFAVEENCVLSIMAVAEGYANSAVNVRTVTLPENDDSTVAPPVIAVKTEGVIGGKLVSLTCATEGASIYYTTTEGATPDKLYTGPIFASGTQFTIYTVAKKSGKTDSKLMTFKVANYDSSSPTASVPTNTAVEAGSKVELIGGTYSVPILDSDNNETGRKDMDYVVYYTLDGSEPTLDSPVYSEPIEITGETLIRAASAGEQHALSPVADFYYTIEGAAYAIAIDTSGLQRDSGAILGSVSVDISGVQAENGRVYVAAYSGGEMVDVKSAPFAENLTFDNFVILSSGTVIIKAFVFLDDDSIQPLCENSVAVF